MALGRQVWTSSKDRPGGGHVGGGLAVLQAGWKRSPRPANRGPLHPAHHCPPGKQEAPLGLSLVRAGTTPALH